MCIRPPPGWRAAERTGKLADSGQDRKSTRLNSSHLVISYAVFCLKKKNEFATESEQDVTSARRGPIRPRVATPATVRAMICQSFDLIAASAIAISCYLLARLAPTA